MNTLTHWDPRSPDVIADPIGAYDAMRQRCPVAYSDTLHLSVLGHAEAMRVLLDHATFSSQVSHRVSVPNSMDPPEHDLYRRIIDPYFSAEQVAKFTPVCQARCEHLVMHLPMNGEVELMSALALPFAVQMQAAFLGWPDSTHQPLLQWIDKKNAAVQAGDYDALADVATEFDVTIRSLIDRRRELGAAAFPDVTTRLMREQVDGRLLSDTEIISILRNWTVGELGTMASSVGIIAYYLATHASLQQQLRKEPHLIAAANDEILRIHAPLLTNRRRATTSVSLAGQQLKAGDRVSILWASVNRDKAVFGDPDEFRLDRDPALNLLYGAGIHVCPGAPLARMELVSIISALLKQTVDISPVDGKRPSPEAYPSSGYREVYLRINN